MVFKFVVLVILLIGTTAAGVFDPATESSIRSYIESTMKCRKVPGLTMAVVKDSETWTSGFGIADVDTGRQVNSQSQFGIGSCTKAFTMTLLGMLLDEHGFTWSSKVSDVLGYEFKFVDDIRTKEMTIKDILSHRTGLAKLDLAVMAGYLHNITTRADLSKRIRFMPAKYEFRDKFYYNNYLYMLCGYICEVLGKDSWENLLTSRILEPLAMTSTIVMRDHNDAFSDSSAQPHIYRNGQFVKGTQFMYDIFPAEPAGAIVSSADDMTKWMLFNIRRGQLENGTQLIKSQLLDEAFSGIIPVPRYGSMAKPEFLASDFYNAYGLGWYTSSYRGHQSYRHSGGLYSYVTMLWIYPDSNVGLYANVNGPGFDSGVTLVSLLFYLSDLLLGEDPWMNKTTMCTFPEPWREIRYKKVSVEESGSLVDAQEYEGRYGHPFLPDVVIFAKPDEKNKLGIVINRVSGTLRPSVDKDRFLFEITSPWELVRERLGDNNVTLEHNAMFVRNSGEVSAIVFAVELNVTFTKGTSFSDSAINGTGSFNGVCVRHFLLWSLAFIWSELKYYFI